MQTPLVLQIKGNSGSGKTHTARAFMALCKNLPLMRPGLDPLQNSLYSFQGKKWLVIGRYSTACGGADTVKTQQEIIDRIEAATRAGFNVLVEGLILSTIYGTVGAYSEKFGDRWLFCYLQPPIEECVRRIKARRAAAGNLKPLNEMNTRNRVSTIQRNKEIVLGHGRRVIELDWRDPLPALLKLIRKEAA